MVMVSHSIISHINPIGIQGLVNGGRWEGEWKNDQRHGKMSRYGQSFYGWMYNKMYRDGEELDLCTCEVKNPLDHGKYSLLFL